MEDSTVWWLLAGAAVALELATGTLYLLMLALGLAGGALAAHVGASVTAQIVVAGLMGVAALATAWTWRQRRPRTAAQADRDVNLDVGETVHVTAWAPDHTAIVRYRGANWTVVPFGGEPQGAGAHRVREVSGSRLVVEKI